MSHEHVLCPAFGSRCRAVLPPGAMQAGPYHGRCDLRAKHEGPHVLERGADCIHWRTLVVS